MSWISREIKALKEKYNTTNPFELADYLEYLLIPYPFKKLNGMLLVIDDTTFIIYNSNLPLRMQELVICHEVGHKLLHPEGNYFMLLSNACSNHGKYEKQADRFAAELVLAECEARPGETIYEFAARYEVPVELVKLLVDQNKMFMSTANRRLCSF